MSVTRLEHATLLTMTPGSAPITDGTLQWTDSTLTYVGPGATAPSEPADEVIDGTGCVALPGLINSHTHLAMTLFRGFADDMPLKPWLEEKIWPTEAKLKAEDVYWGTRLGVLELLRSGCTCFNDMYHYYPEATQAAVDGGIRACPSGVLLGFLKDDGDVVAKAVDFARAIRAEHGATIHPMLGPHAPYTCPKELLLSVAQAAGENDLPVHIHVAETQHEVEESLAATGATPIQYLDRIGLLECRTVAAHCVWLDDRDIDILVERQVGVAHCPASNMKLASGFARTPELLSAGAVVGLGTDGAASNNRLDLFNEMYLAATVHKVRGGDPTLVKAGEALAMATRNGARVLAIEDLVGTLETGKRADLCLVDLSSPRLQPVHNVASHMVYAAEGSDVKMTVVNGRIVMRDGQFPGQDACEVYEQCRERARRLCSN